MPGVTRRGPRAPLAQSGAQRVDGEVEAEDQGVEDPIQGVVAVVRRREDDDRLDGEDRRPDQQVAGASLLGCPADVPERAGDGGWLR